MGKTESVYSLEWEDHSQYFRDSPAEKQPEYKREKM